MTNEKPMETNQAVSLEVATKIKGLQKMGGTAALIGAGTTLLGLVVYLALLAPRGYGSDNPGQIVMFLVDNQALMRAWYQIIYVVFGVSMVLLSFALHERLTAGSPPRSSRCAMA